jgi:hypothetical protein
MVGSTSSGKDKAEFRRITELVRSKQISEEAGNAMIRALRVRRELEMADRDGAVRTK